MTDAYALGGRIAAERKSMRALAVARCPVHRQHVIAAVYVVDGGPVFWLRGGRAGSHAEMVAEFERSRSDALWSVHDALRRGDTDHLATAADSADLFSDLLDEIREERHPGFAPPMANPLADGPWRPWQGPAACSRCRHDRVVRLDGDGVLSAE